MGRRKNKVRFVKIDQQLTFVFSRVMGLPKFQKYKNSLFTRGKLLHTNIQNYLETRDTSVLTFKNKQQENLWKSVEHVLPKISKVYKSEMDIFHPYLKYQGKIDCIASYHDIPTVIEWKTSEKLKPTLAHTYDNALQAVAYLACLQFFNFSKLSPIPEVDEVIVVVAYEDGTKANVHIVEPSYRLVIWKQFLHRLQLYWSMQANDLS